MSTIREEPSLRVVEKKAYPYYIENPVQENRVEKFLEAFAAVLKYTDYKPLLDSYCSSNAKCNRCAVTCPIFLTTRDPRDIPCYRTNLLLDTYKRYFTIGGWFKSRFANTFELTEDMIDEMLDLFYRCTACRRCTRECPMGVDHGMMTRLGRYILSLIGIVPKALQVSTREQLEGETHNTSQIPKAALLDTLDFLAEEIKDIFDLEVQFPVDKMKRDYVFFCAVSDYLLEPDTLIGNAIVLYAAGDWDKWTIGTCNYDGINYGLFYSDWHLENIIKQLIAEVDRLKGRNILIGECGHASRSAHQFVPVFSNGKPYPVYNFMEYTLDCIRKDKIRLNKNIITEKVTYHDPCNIARSGWIVDQPREILRSFVPNFVEMEPHGRDNYCCGGGGGLVSIDEIHDFRMNIAGKIKVEQIKKTGAEILISPCANCKKQLKELVEHYQIPCQVMGLHDLIMKAIEIPGASSAEERKADAELMAM
jgi:Fe-S oxidoreductase